MAMTTERLLDVTYGEVNGRPLTLDLYRPQDVSGSGPRAAALVIHGGGWEGGDKREDSCVRDAEFFAGLGLLAVSIGYRLSGEAPAPAALEDCRCAVRWLRAHAADLDLDPSRLVACGGSAGGHLALMLALGEPGAFEGDAGWPDVPGGVNAAISYVGVTDVEDLLGGPHERTFAHKWLPFPEAERLDLARRLSPVNLARPDAPPVLIAHGDADDLVPFNQAERLVDALNRAGADVTFHRIPGGGHGTWPDPGSEARYKAAKRSFLEHHGFLPPAGERHD